MCKSAAKARLILLFFYVDWRNLQAVFGHFADFASESRYNLFKSNKTVGKQRKVCYDNCDSTDGAGRAVRKGVIMREAILGKTVTVIVDRPLGSTHPEYPGLRYPVNYGYVAGVEGGDGEPQDAYVLGIHHPVEQFTGPVIAVIRRWDDLECKWVVAPPRLHLHQGQIMEQVHFQEQFFHSRISALYERSCGLIPYRFSPQGIEYLILLQRGSRTWSFPKGHMECFESEHQTAARELFEETQQTCTPIPGFRETLTYSLGHQRKKTVVLFLGRVDHVPQLQRTEILEARFVSRAEALRLLHHTPYRRILEHAEQTILAQTMLPEHQDGVQI